MKVYLFYPNQKILEYMSHDIDSDGIPFTNNKILADLFFSERCSRGEFEMVVRKISKEEYERIQSEFWQMEIIQYFAVADIHKPELDDYPKAEMIPVTILREEKVNLDEAFVPYIDSWSSDQYIPNIDIMKDDVKDALKSLSFMTYSNLGSMIEYRDEPDFEINTEVYLEDMGHYFDDSVF